MRKIKDMKDYYYTEEEIDLVVEYTFDPGEQATYEYPPEGFSLYMHKVYVDADSSKVDISPLLKKDVQKRIEQGILEHEENHSYDDIYEDYSDDRT